MKRKTRKRLALLALVAAAGALTVGGLYVAREHRRAARIESALVDGMAAHEAGDHEGVVRNLGTYVNNSPEPPNDEVMLAFAASLREVEDPNGRLLASAIQVLRTVVERQGSIGEAHERLMDAYIAAGLMSELETLCSRMLEMEPGHKRATLTRVTSLVRLGREDEAVELAASYAEANPSDVDGTLVYLQTLRSADRPTSEIADRAREAAATDGAGPLVRLMSAAVLMRAGDRGASTRIVESVTNRPSDLSAGELTAALTLTASLGLDDPAMGERTVDLLRATLSPEASADLRMLGASWAWRQGDLATAAEAVRGLTENPDDPAALGLGLLLNAEAATSGLEPLVEIASGREKLEALAGDEASAWLTLLAGHERLVAGEAREARTRLATLAEEEQGLVSEIASFYLADALAQVGERTAAISRLERLVRHPSWRRARFVLSGHHLASGSDTDAIRVLLREPTLRRWPAGVERLVRATIRAVEGGSTGPVDAMFAQELTAEYVELLGREPRAIGFRSRALLAAEQTAQGLDLARELMSDGSLTTLGDDALDLVAAVERTDATLAAEMRQTLRDAEAGGLSLLIEDLRRIAERESPRAALRWLEERAAAGLEIDALPLQLMRATLLDDAQDPSALDALRELAVSHPDEAGPQLALLRSRAGWTDLGAVESAITRLQRITGAEGTRWRVASARLDLTRDTSPATASDALLRLESVLASAPNDTRALVLAADAARRLDSIEDEIAYLERAIEADPSFAAAYPPLIEALVASGERSLAEARLRTFATLELGPLGDRLAARRASLLESAALSDLALPDRRRLAEGGDPDRLAELGVTLARVGRMDEASRVLLEATTDPSELSAPQTAAAAGALALLGRTEAGLALLRGLPAVSEVGPRALIMAEFLADLGRFGEAAGVLEDAIRADDADERVWLRLVRTYAVTGNEADAADAAARAAAALPSNEVATLLATVFAEDSGEQLGLRRLAALTYAGQPEEAEAAAAFARGTIDVAELGRRLTPAVRNPAASYELVRLAAQARLADADPVGAAAVFDLAMASRPGDARPARDATELLIAIASFREAARMARNWAERAPGDRTGAELAEAFALAATGDDARALELFDRHRGALLEAEAGFDRERAAYAVALARVGRARDAIAIIGDRVERSEAWAGVAAETALLIEDTEEGRRLLDRAAATLRPTASGRARLVSALHQRAVRSGDPEAFEAVLRAAPFRYESHTSEAAATWSFLGSALVSLGRLDEAEPALRLALEADPDQPGTLNNLAHVLSTRGAYEEAAPFAARAVELGRARQLPAETLREFYDTHGLIRLALGDAAGAEALFRSGLDLSPETPHLVIGLAEALIAQGRDDEAASLLDAIEQQVPGVLRPRFNRVRAGER